MPRDTGKPNEFKHYRQVLATLYLAVAGAGVVLLAASVARQLLFHRPAVALRGPMLSADNPDPAELVRCNTDVAELLLRMGTVSAEILAGPTRADERDLGRRWEDFSRVWLDDWYEVNLRCRFSELAGTSMGLAYDRMAKVHGDLPAMRLRYQSLLVQFDEEQAAELARMRRALDQSRAALVKPPGEPGTPTKDR